MSFILVYLILGFLHHHLVVRAEAAFQLIPQTDPSFVYDPRWWSTATSDQSTSSGTLYGSFIGSTFILNGTFSTQHDGELTVWLDGDFYANYTSTDVWRIDTALGEHQIMVKVTTSTNSTTLFGFHGISVDTSNLPNKQYLPEKYGVMAQEVSSNARTMDDQGACITYHGTWVQTSGCWGCGETTSSAPQTKIRTSSLTIVFKGTGLWLFATLPGGNQTITFNTQMESISELHVNDWISTSPTVQPVYQKLVYSRTGMTPGIHILDIEFPFTSYDYNAAIEVDYFRIDGEAFDCLAYYREQSVSGVTTTWLTTSSAVLFFVALLACWPSLRRKAKQRPTLKPLSLPSPTSTFRDLESPQSDSDRPQVRVLPIHTTYENLPHFARLPLSLLIPYELATQPPPQMPSDSKAAQWISPVESRNYTSDTSSSFQLSSSEASTIVTSDPAVDERGPSLRDNILGLTSEIHPDDLSSSPPPSYLTELESPTRPTGFLSQRDLSRLVDRVTELRGRGRKGLEYAPRLQVQAEEEEEADETDDPVEVLARRIAREPTSPS